MNDYQWDKKLKINTIGRDAFHADEYHYPYEPTPYSVLERLVESGYLDQGSILVDYGCGKGRVDFFLSHEVGCQTIGIEYEESIYQSAKENQKTYAGKRKPEFIQKDAKEFQVEDADCFYFFNPFSVEILRAVIDRIIASYYNNPREMHLFFYYPDDEYVSYLMTVDELLFLDEIDCQDLFAGKNERERILVFGSV